MKKYLKEKISADKSRMNYLKRQVEIENDKLKNLTIKDYI